MRRSADTGFTLIELLIVVAIIAIIAAIASPGLMRAKMSSNESSAIGSLRSVNSGENAFSTVCGSGFYTLGLVNLVDAGYVSPDLAVSPKSGYALALGAGLNGLAGAADCQGGPTHSAYYASAAPISAIQGTRAFATNAGGTIWQNTAGIAPPEPFLPSPTISPLR